MQVQYDGASANSIQIDGELHSLLTEPARALLDQFDAIPFCASSTANWRGFTTEWAIRHNRLYLVDLVGTVCRRSPEIDGEPSSWCSVNHRGPCDIFPVSLRDICDAPKGGIPATWFTGELRIPAGSLLDYVHAGWASVYEQERIVAVSEGQIVGERDVRPEPSNYPFRTEGLRKRLAVIFRS